MSNASYSLFIGDLSVFCTREDLKQLFSPFGVITDIRIKQDMNTGKKLSYGFVEFDNINAAMNALNHMNGHVLCGRPMRIRWGTNRSVKKYCNAVKMVPNVTETASVHVSFCVAQQSVIIVSEESLRNTFSEFGYVIDATIKKTVCSKSNEGYGFIHYANTPQGIESAINAVATMNNAVDGDVHYRVGLSLNLEKQLNEMMNRPILYGPAVRPVDYYQPQPMMYYPASYYNVGMPQYMPTSSAGFYYQNQPQLIPMVGYSPPAYIPLPPQEFVHEKSELEVIEPMVKSVANSPSVDEKPEVTPTIAIINPVAKTIDIVVELVKYSKDELIHEVSLVDSSCADTCTSPSCTYEANESVKIAAMNEKNELQSQLDAARDECAASKHSTIDVYMDAEEHVACVDIIDY